MRLDDYESHHHNLFGNVIDIIQEKFVPVFKRHALSGAAKVVIPKSDSSYPIVSKDLAVSMIIDILADREFNVFGVENDLDRVKFDIRFRTRGLHQKN